MRPQRRAPLLRIPQHALAVLCEYGSVNHQCWSTKGIERFAGELDDEGLLVWVACECVGSLCLGVGCGHGITITVKNVNPNVDRLADREGVNRQ